MDDRRRRGRRIGSTGAYFLAPRCWRPGFARYLYPRYTGLRRELDTYLEFYNHDRIHHGRLTHGRKRASRLTFTTRSLRTMRRSAG
jgi:hypothetical protein